MRSRPLRPSDIPILQALAARSGFPYPDLSHPHIEAVVVVVDSEDKPIAAAAAKRLIEAYLYIDPDCSPAVKIAALRLIHTAMAHELRALLYNSVECFLPTQIAAKFGRRLERTWGWVKNWQSWTIHF